VPREGTTVYELRLHPQDVGKIIGRQGMTINAIRSLLLAGARKKGCAARWKSSRKNRRVECWSSSFSWFGHPWRGNTSQSLNCNWRHEN